MMSALSRLTRPANLTGFPAISVPCGFTQGDLPIGLQLIGRPFAETTILQLAHAYEQETTWHQRRSRCSNAECAGGRGAGDVLHGHWRLYGYGPVNIATCARDQYPIIERSRLSRLRSRTRIMPYGTPSLATMSSTKAWGEG